MSFSRPQSHPQLAHQRGEHVTRKGRVYYYRRRHPFAPTGELGVSLRTTRYREAQALAEQIDRWLAHTADWRMTTAALTQAIRDHLTELRAGTREDFMQRPPGRSVFHTAVPDDEEVTDFDADFAAGLIGDARRAIAERDWDTVRRDVSQVAARHGITANQHNELAAGILDARIRALEELREAVLGRMPQSWSHISQQQGTFAATSTTGEPTAPTGPLFSSLVDPFLEQAAHQQKKPWDKARIGRARTVFRMLREFVGDKPVEAYKRSELHRFYKALALLPATHGRSPREREMDMAARIEAAIESDAKRLSSGTIEHYGTTLIALFNAHKDVDDTSWANPAEGFNFTSVGETSEKRMTWSHDDLARLFAHPVWQGMRTPARPRDAGDIIVSDGHYWLPLLALYTGARREELARLVRSDIIPIDGGWFFNVLDDKPPAKKDADSTVQPLERKARLKSVAARRRIPLHPRLCALGFMDHVEHTAPNGSDFVFPELRTDAAKDTSVGSASVTGSVGISKMRTSLMRWCSILSEGP